MTEAKRFGFKDLLAIMMLYVRIEARMNELKADGDLGTENILMLIIEFEARRR